ncbi:MAG TPA: NUDIX hydrolase [Smithellaceae bacterium]|nr:NUDIX hydrolase [Smithellaceae bacterium]
MKKQRQFCPYCGGRIGKKKEDHVLRDCCSSCQSYFYDNPLPVVSAIVEESRQILLVKRDRPPFKGYWCLPTGFAETGENIESAALRELYEETGLKGRISRFLDVDSYKSRFYGDLLFLTFVVQRTGGKLSAGDDSAQARFWPIDDTPHLAFRSNRRALSAYIRSKKDYWAVMDSIDRASGRTPGPSANELTTRLIKVLIKNKEIIIRHWIDEMTGNPSTFEYHQSAHKRLHTICDKVISQLILWLGDIFETARIKNFYLKLGHERRNSGFSLSGVLSALSLIRKHIWDTALLKGSLQKSVDLYMSFELQRRMTIYFDLATFYITQGFEKEK